MKILVVDDNTGNLYLLEKLLVGNGYETVVANNGEEALEQLHNESVDLIISDILMPVMDGFQLCKSIRADDRFKHLPFIFYTATYTSDKDEVFALDLGADQFIRKPSEPEDFIQIIQELLQKHAQKKIKPRTPLLKEEEETYKVYSERLVTKLEKKMLDLESEARERERAFKLLMESKRFSENLIASMKDGFHVMDAQGKTLQVNPAFCRMTGYSAKELVDSVTPKPYWPEEEYQKIGAAFRKLLKCGFEDQELIFKRKDGDRFPVIVSPACVMNEEKRVTRYIETIKDISERYLASKALRESEKRYRDLFTNAVEGILVADVETKAFKYANPAVCEFLGYTEEELTRMSVNDIHPGHAKKFIISEFDALARGERQLSADIPCLHKDGTIKYADIKATPVSIDGRLCNLGFFQDITDKKRADEERIRLSTAIEQAVESIIITDRYGKIQYINPAFENISGFQKKDILGRNMRILKSGEHDDSFYRNMWNIISRGDIWSGHIKNRMKNGNICEFETTISPIRNKKGKVVHFVSVNRDVSHEVALETRLRQAQKMESIGTLAGGIAHDFNNILSAIFGFTELAMDDSDPKSPVQGHLNEVLRAAGRAKELVQQILTFSRQTEEEFKPVKVKPLVEEALKLLRATLPSTIEIKRYLKQDLVSLAVPTQLHQVVMNLCANAGYAMHNKGGVLEVKLDRVQLDDEFITEHPDLSPGFYNLLTVKDNGTGMPSDVFEQIFDPFFTTKRPGEGTGMGLAVVHGIVKSHGGAIYAYTEEGEGSIFRVYIPAIELRPDSETKTKMTLPVGTERILFVEDEPSLAKLGKILLESLGYIVIASTSSLEALEIFRENPQKFDLVITDMTMPRMTGYELAKAMIKARSDISVILCSGHSSKLTQSKIEESGVKAFVMKPLIKSELAVIVRNILDRVRD